MKVREITVRGLRIPAGLIIGGFTKKQVSTYVPRLSGDFKWSQASSSTAFVLRGDALTVTAVASMPYDASVEERIRSTAVAQLPDTSGVVLIPFYFSGVIEVWSATGADEDPIVIWDQDVVKEVLSTSSDNSIAWQNISVIRGTRRSGSSPLSSIDVYNLERLGFTVDRDSVAMLPCASKISVMIAPSAYKDIAVPYYQRGSGWWETKGCTIYAGVAFLLLLSTDQVAWLDSHGISEHTQGCDWLTPRVALCNLGDAMRLIEALGAMSPAAPYDLTLVEGSFPAPDSAGMPYLALGSVLEVDEETTAARFAVLTPDGSVHSFSGSELTIPLSSLWAEIDDDNATHFQEVFSEGLLYSAMMSYSMDQEGKAVPFAVRQINTAIGYSGNNANLRINVGAEDASDPGYYQSLLSTPAHVWRPRVFAITQFFLKSYVI